MTVHPPRRVRTFDGAARIYSYETLAGSPPVTPSADGVQGDWARILTPTGEWLCGPKTDDTTWPAAFQLAGTTGPAGPSVGAWVTGTAYTTGQRATFNSVDYVALSNHTSAAAFRTDIGTGKWAQVNAPAGGRMESLDPAFMNALAVWPVANRVYYFRVMASGAISHVTTEIGIQSGNLVVGAYANNGSQGRSAAPATSGLLATSGSVACPAVGVQQISLGSTIGVAAGDWLAMAFDNVTAKVRAFASASAAGVTTGRYGYELLSAFPTLPATPAPVWAATFSCWLAGEA